MSPSCGRAGWIHTTFAELVISYVPALDTAFVLEVEALRLAWPDVMRLFHSTAVCRSRGCARRH
jgi:hypothetical protein